METEWGGANPCVPKVAVVPLFGRDVDIETCFYGKAKGSSITAVL